MFPSPCGVSFILIYTINKIDINFDVNSFRLLAEYHSFLSAREWLIFGKYINIGFRLLAEYHSFLSIFFYFLMYLRYIFSFRLLAEYHSFLFKLFIHICCYVLYLVSVSLRSIIHSYRK